MMRFSRSERRQAVLRPLSALAVALAASVALGAVARPAHAGTQILASGTFRMTLKPRADEYVAFPYPDTLLERFLEHHTCAQGTHRFSWKVLRPSRPPAGVVRFYWHYRGYRTLGTGPRGQAMVNICSPLFVENKTRSVVVVEIRYRVIHLTDDSQRI